MVHSIHITEMQIIHIVGPVGAGKTTFIKRFFPMAPIFDIKDVYSITGYKPEDLKEPDAYNRFQNAMEFHFDGMIKQAEIESPDQPLIIESSGINKAINSILARFSPLTIWIESNYEQTIYQERPYAIDLNKIIRNAFNSRKLLVDAVYQMETKEFIKEPPAPFLKLFDKKRSNKNFISKSINNE